MKRIAALVLAVLNGIPTPDLWAAVLSETPLQVSRTYTRVPAACTSLSLARTALSAQAPFQTLGVSHYSPATQLPAASALSAQVGYAAISAIAVAAEAQPALKPLENALTAATQSKDALRSDPSGLSARGLWTGFFDRTGSKTAVTYALGHFSSGLSQASLRASQAPRERGAAGDSVPAARLRPKAWGVRAALIGIFLGLVSLFWFGALHRPEPAAPQPHAAIAAHDEIHLQQRLLEQALKARDNAYAPFSHYHVGSAVATPIGVFTGANIENPNRKLTMHAERLATLKALTAGAREISDMSVIHGPMKDVFPADVAQKWHQHLHAGSMLHYQDFPSGDYSSAPCGECRQALLGFQPLGKSMNVLYGSKDGTLFRDTLDDLLPSSYKRKESKAQGAKGLAQGVPIVLESKFSKNDPRSDARLQQELFAAAETVLPNSYIPYPSKDPKVKERKRAAAVLTRSGHIYLGVSVFYTPAADAAEVAVFSAYSEGARQEDILAIAIVEEEGADLAPRMAPDTLETLNFLAPNATLVRRTQSGAIRVDRVSALAARLPD